MSKTNKSYEFKPKRDEPKSTTSKFIDKILLENENKKKNKYFKFEQDFVDEIKKMYNIPNTYSTYVFDDEQERIRKILVKRSKKMKHELNLAYGKGYGIEVEAELGCFKIGKDYIVVYKKENVSYLGWILFTLDFDALMEKYFPEKEIAELYHGIYTIEKTQGGMTLMRHKIDTSIKPILNDNLLPKLKKEIKCFMEMKEFYDAHSFDHKRGILLYGNPGNGKTTIIKQLLSKQKAVSILCNITSEGQLDFLCDFLDDKKLDSLLKIIVLEDIDGMDPYKRSLLLNMIDGVFNLSNTIFIATTNFPSKLDTALINRPSRIDSMYEIGAPNKKSRMQFLKLYFNDCTKEELVEGVELTKDFKGCYFKEVYLIKTFEKCSLAKAVEKFQEKFELLKKLQKETNYVG